jgi:hypothetical protein
MMRGYLVDPFAKTVTEVETTGYPHFKELIDVDMIAAVTIRVYTGNSMMTPKRDTVWVDDEGLLKEGEQKFFQVSSYDQPLAGKGICLGTDEEGETVGAYMQFDLFKSMVTFPKVELDHMESIPEGTTEFSPIFNEEIPVVGSYPVFRPASETESDDKV